MIWENSYFLSRISECMDFWYSLIFECRINFPLSVSAVFVVIEYAFLPREILVFWAQNMSLFGCDDSVLLLIHW